MSIDRKPDEKKLSRAVLDLKFMKKSKEKREILDDAEERQQLYQDQLSMLHEGADRIVMLSSYFDCKKFLPCRLSFGGMDPDIEKLNEDKLTGLYKVIKVDLPPATGGAFTGMAADIDEEEMAESYLASNIRQKFGVKRKSELDDYGFEEDNKEAALGNGDRKILKAPRGRGRGRELFTANIEGGRGSFRGRGDSRGRGRGDSRGRGRGDSRGRGRGDSRGRGRGDSRGRGRGDSRGRGRGDSGGRGRGDSRGRGRGDSRGRGRGDFRGRGRGDFRGRGRGEFRGRGRDDFRGRGGSHGRNESQEDQGNTFNQDNNSDFIIDGYDEHSPKKMKFMKPDSD